MTDDLGKRIPEFKRAKLTGRGKMPPFIGIPRDVLDSTEFGSLSAHATKLAIELARQFRGHNNGDFDATFGKLRKRGWTSAYALNLAKKELLETGFVITTRHGGRNQCSLFALTWWAVDDCKGKHQEKPTHAPLQLWKRPNR